MPVLIGERPEGQMVPCGLPVQTRTMALLEADRDAAEMVARAGFPGRVCQNDISFSHRSTGNGSATKDDSTHPGYEDRLAAMTKYYDALEKKTVDTQSGPAALIRYHHNSNLLTVLPQGR